MVWLDEMTATRALINMSSLPAQDKIRSRDASEEKSSEKNKKGNRALGWGAPEGPASHKPLWAVAFPSRASHHVLPASVCVSAVIHWLLSEQDEKNMVRQDGSLQASSCSSSSILDKPEDSSDDDEAEEGEVEDENASDVEVSKRVRW